MEAIAVIVVIWIAGALLVSLFSEKPPKGTHKDNSSYRSPSSTRTSSPPSRPSLPPATHKPGTYRPRSSTSAPSPKIEFTDTQNIVSTATQTGTAISKKDLEGLNDAFTGAPLDPALGLYHCSVCKVFYHKESYDLLVEVNSSRCVSCSRASIKALTETEARSAEHQNFRPDVITLSEVKGHTGRVVTFRGFVHDVKVSQRGSDYAVMFENTSWTRGFKLVFFKNAARTIGIDYIKGLKGKTITARGLVIQHERFGYQMIISQKSMILED